MHAKLFPLAALALVLALSGCNKDRTAALIACHNQVREGASLDANFEQPTINCMTERQYGFALTARHCAGSVDDPDCYKPLSTFGGLTDWIERLWKSS